MFFLCKQTFLITFRGLTFFPLLESQVAFELSNYFKMGHSSFHKWENSDENHKCLYYKRSILLFKFSMDL